MQGIAANGSGTIPATPTANYVMASLTLPAGYWDVMTQIALTTPASGTNNDEVMACDITSATANFPLAGGYGYIALNEDHINIPIDTFLHPTATTTYSVRCLPEADPQASPTTFAVAFNTTVQAIEVAAVTGPVPIAPAS